LVPLLEATVQNLVAFPTKCDQIGL
jgi:hypothetical protein